MVWLVDILPRNIKTNYIGILCAKVNKPVDLNNADY